MITTVKGNILNCKEPLLCHQVNCQGVMGAGLARQIRDRYPEVFTEYKKLCTAGGDNLLGWIQPVPVYNNIHQTPRMVVNIFGQKYYGKGLQTDYEALKAAFGHLKNAYRSMPVAIPYNMGCGLAGGDWQTVYSIIEEVFCEDTDTVVIYKL